MLALTWLSSIFVLGGIAGWMLAEDHYILAVTFGTAALIDMAANFTFGPSILEKAGI